MSTLTNSAVRSCIYIMDRATFASQACSLAQASAAFPAFCWQWHEASGSLGYLSLHTTLISHSSPIQLSLSVCYSVAYSVPVLYFRACDLSGSPISVELILSAEAMKTDEGLRWGLVSPIEHPITGQPYFYLHPCQTANLLSGQPELLCWLSSVLPIVQLRFPLPLASILMSK